MADHGEPTEDTSMAVPDAGRASHEKVEKLARKLLYGGDGNDITDLDSARAAARRMIEESEARTLQNATMDPEDDDVIRRSSSETAAIGDTGQIRRVHDGD